MQNRDRSSRDPAGLIEKFKLRDEAALNYMPTEESTLVINFVECWNKSAERKGAKRFSPFKNSLAEQFSMMSYDLTEFRDLITFIWSNLYRLQNKPMRNVFLSHPSFLKSLSDPGQDVTLENVALRIPLDKTAPGESRKLDLVLMGNIVITEGKIPKKEYVVKGLSLMINSPHYGEIMVKTALVCRVMNSVMEGFYTTKGELADGRGRGIYNNSILTPTLLSELNEHYIVKEPHTVIAKLNDWVEFLTNESKYAQSQSVSSYTIERPEFLTAYRIPAGTDAGKGRIIVETPDAIWTDTAVEGSEPRLIVRISHKADPRAVEYDSKYVERFNSLVLTGIRIVDPTDKHLDNRFRKDSAERALEKRMSRVGNEYLNPTEVHGLLPDEVTAPARLRRDQAVAGIRSGFEDRITKELENSVAQGEDPEVARIEIEQRLAQERKLRIKEVNNEFREEIDRLYSGCEDCTLTIYFEIPVPRGTSTKNEMESRTKFFAKGRHYVVVSDQVGTMTNISRQMDALVSFLKGEVANPYIASHLFYSGTAPTDSKEEIGHLFGNNFNELQKKAINEAVASNGLYLIQGPPGTGKTQVISEITIQEILKGRKVLITSQNNKAIDNAFDRLVRNAVVRPVRIMSENGSSEYEIENIVSTLYRNIGKSLRDQMRLYDDPESKVPAEEKYARIKELREEMEELAEDAEEPIEEIPLLYEDIAFAKQKILDIEREKAENESNISLVNTLIAGLGTFELTSYTPFVKEIKDVFREYSTLEAKNAASAENELEGKLFGRHGYCAAIMSIPQEEFDEQMMLMDDNRDYVSLFTKLYDTDNESEKIRLSASLEELVATRGIEPSAFGLLETFRADLPRNLPEIRSRLERIRSKMQYLLNARLEQYAGYMPNEADEKKKRKLLADSQEELEEYLEDKDYIAYAKVRQELTEAIRDMFEYLNISDRYDDLEEAISILDLRMSMITEMGSEDLELTRKTLSDIESYLSKEGVGEIESDRLVKELRKYVNVVGITSTAEGVARDKDLQSASAPFLDVTTMGVDTVIIDEVSKVPFPELLRPILAGKKVILVGDHKQLSPLYNVKINEHTRNATAEEIENEQRYKVMYETPLFEELFDGTDDGCKTMLRTQYRMAEPIMQAINRFYDGGLETGCAPGSREHNINVPGIIGPDTSIMFVNCKGNGIRREGSTSYENPLEANVVFQLVKMFEEHCEKGVNGKPLSECNEDDKLSMGVISPYASHNRLIRRKTNGFYESLA
ncbi:MAG: AAA domain-containing protein, partial [archaeon]|nr:AAA domain-containing protein [archaeon]